MNEGETVTNEQGGKQSFVAARLDLIPPKNQLLLGECLGFGARKYGEHNWQNIPIEDNLNHLMVHVTKWLAGDRSEPHLVNVLARGNFALWHAVESGEQPERYIHPDMCTRCVCGKIFVDQARAGICDECRTVGQGARKEL